MSYIKSRKHAPCHPPRLNRTVALTALAITLPATALADEPKQLQAVDVSAPAINPDSYTAERAASTKYTAPLVDTPKSVTVITREVLRETNATSLQDALRSTPGITFGMGEGGNPAGDRPFIRGFDSQGNLFIDGLRDPGSQSRDMFNVEQVDVIKGPDSAFSGGGAVGGSINLTTKQARLGDFGEVDVGFGTDKYMRATVDLNRQLGETSALRLNLLGFRSDVPGRDEVDLNHWGVAPSLALGLGTPTRVNLDYYHFQTDDMPDYGIPYNNPISPYLTVTSPTAPTGKPTANPAASQNGDGGPLGVDRNNFYGLVDRDFRKTRVDSGTVRIEHDLNDQFTLRNATRYTRSLNDYVVTNPGDSSANIVNGSPTMPRSSKNRHSSSEVIINATELTGHFLTGAIKHTIATGFEISRTEVDNRGYTVTGTSNANIQNPNPHDPWTGSVVRATAGTKTTTNTQGLYAFDTLTLNPQWLLNLGLRYDRFDTEQRAYTTNGTAPNAASNLSSDSTFWSYQAGIVFKPLENGSIYLNYSTAANPPGIAAGDGADSISATNKDLEPEKTRSIELGTKWNLLDNRLSLSGAIFNITKTNAKVNVDANTMATVGKQEINGFELGIAGVLTPKWQVFGGYTYLDSELKETGDSYWSTRNGTSWSYNNNAANKGNQFPNTPKNSFSLWTTYKFLPQLTVGGGAYYMSRVYGDPANTKWVPSYWRFDAMASYDITRNVSVRLNVTNLFDKTYYDKAYVTHMVSVAPGRQAVLSANVKF